MDGVAGAFKKIPLTNKTNEWFVSGQDSSICTLIEIFVPPCTIDSKRCYCITFSGT